MSRYKVPTFTRTVKKTKVTFATVKVTDGKAEMVTDHVDLFGEFNPDEAEEIVKAKVISCEVTEGLYAWKLDEIMPLAVFVK